MLFIGDDWAKDHHDVELQDVNGKRLTRARLAEGIAGIARLHQLIAEHLPAEDEPTQVVIGIETDRGPWVAALVAAGYQTYAINPLQAARYRERYATSGAKSDAGDARLLADIVRTDRHRHRQVSGDSAQVDGIKVLARAHQTLIWDRTRQVQRLQSALREYFPAALQAFDDLTASDALELLNHAPDPAAAAALSHAQVAAALRRGHRHNVDAKAAKVVNVFNTAQLGQPPALTRAYAETARALILVIDTLNAQIKNLHVQLELAIAAHTDMTIYLSQPGMGVVLAARTLGEFGDDELRFTDARSRKNYAGSAPVTRASGRSKIIMARYACNDRLRDATHQWAFCAMRHSPGTRAYYNELRNRGKNHHAALRQVANRLVGILHGCLASGMPYSEEQAWAHRVPAA